MNLIRAILLLTLSISLGCATTEEIKNEQSWQDLKNSDAYQKEKSTYHKRLGDQNFCWDIGLDDFLNAYSNKPNEKCIYPASKLAATYETGKKTLAQNFKQLKILQVISNGFVIQSPNHRNDQVIFVYKSDEKNLVDGSFLDETQNMQIYEYAGTYSYATAIGGSKTVHSFRKANKKLGEIRKDIRYYDPLREFLIENKIWGSLGDYSKNSDFLLQQQKP